LFHVGQDRYGSQVPGLLQSVQEAVIPEFLSIGAGRLRDSVREDAEHVAGFHASLSHRALPFPEQSQYRRGRRKPLDVSTSAQQERRTVSAVDIAQAARVVVITAEEEGRVAIGLRVTEEVIVHSSQQDGKVAAIDSGAVVEAPLQIRHEQGRRHPLAGNVGHDKPDSARSQVEEIIIVAADGARLNAPAGVIERSQGRPFPGEKLALHRSGHGDFLQQGFVIGSRRHVQVPDVALWTDTLHTGVTRSEGSGQADPDNPKERLPRPAANFHKFAQLERFAAIRQTGT